ncbi:MAG: short-chain dehydrogenase [Deltaproteobacteria bacterium]|nr:short-chain dehydrogenase [Deltaproteobacteria bacterium]
MRQREPHDLEGASVVLAGATGVLGAEIGRQLIKAGARLTLFARDEAKLAQLDLPGPRVVGDIADVDACTECVWEAVTRFGRIDGVVNATGVVAFGPLAELTDETLDELVTTNLIGPVRLMRTVLPELEKGGFLANLSAIVGERPTAGMALYSATKAALSAVDAALARELRARKIDVIDLQPPHTETGLASRPIAGEAPRLPAGKDPESVAQRVVDAIRKRERVVPASEF